MARYYEETECEHGRMIDCDESRIVSRDDDGGYVTEFCPGGVRRELEDVEIVDWCEAHKAPASGRDSSVCLQADWMDFGNWGPLDDPCRLVQTAIIPLSGDTDG